MSKTPIVMAILSAVLFGAATPASKLLLADLTPFQLARFTVSRRGPRRGTRSAVSGGICSAAAHGSSQPNSLTRFRIFRWHSRACCAAFRAAPRRGGLRFTVVKLGARRYGGAGCLCIPRSPQPPRLVRRGRRICCFDAAGLGSRCGRLCPRTACFSRLYLLGIGQSPDSAHRRY